MKFITVTIKNNESDQYNRMCDALEKSIQANCPGATFQKHSLSNYESDSLSEHHKLYIAHTIKLQCWLTIIQLERDNICFIDCDTLVLKDVNHVFEEHFDVAYTKRSAGIQLPLNGGVIFAKPNKASIQFFNDWNDINYRMMYDLEWHAKWHAKYGGINQASLGCLLETKAHLANVIELPCAKYNACDIPDWTGMNEQTHILHIKSQLRQACLQTVAHPELEAAVTIWKGYDQ